MESVSPTSSFPLPRATAERKKFASELTNPQLAALDELQYQVDKRVHDLVKDERFIARYTE
jgi:hypothetical protein